jgi:1,4-dihydroxy-2-naphthoate polyprenyltransferase
MNTVQLWLKAIRMYSLTCGLIPLALGGILAREAGGPFSWLRFVVVLIAGLLLQVAANLWNDYYDFTCGADTPGSGSGSGVLVSGEMSPARCFRGAVICAALAAAGGAWLTIQAGRGLAILGLIGLVAAALYSAGSRSPKHNALGEVLNFLILGPCMTLGGYMAQTGSFSWKAMAIGAPAGLLTALILYTNNLRDMKTDRAAGLRTLPMFFKPTAARLLALILLVIPYGLMGFFIVAGTLPAAVLVIFLSLPLAVVRAVRLWKGPVDSSLVVGVAQLHLLFGLLFAGGLWYGI